MRLGYTALDSKGEEVRGELTAPDIADAIAKLRDRGLYPTSVSEIDEQVSVEVFDGDNAGTEDLPVAELVAEEATGVNTPRVARRTDGIQVARLSPEQGGGGFFDEIFDRLSGSLPSILGGFTFLALFGLFTVQAFYTWWFYLGWLGCLVMALITFKGAVWSFRAFEERELGSMGCSMLFGLVLIASIVVKAPRPIAIIAWEQLHLQIGGHDWVNDPYFGPNQGMWTGSFPVFFHDKSSR